MKRIREADNDRPDWKRFQQEFRNNHYTCQGYTGVDADERILLSFGDGTDNNDHAIIKKQPLMPLPSPPPPGDADEEEAAEEESVFFPQLNTRTGKEDVLQLSIKSNVLQLSLSQVPFMDLFWQAPVMDYMRPQEGIVRKEVMFHLSTAEKADQYFARRDQYIRDFPDHVVTERCLPIKNSGSNEHALAFPPFDNKPYRGPQDSRSLHVGICQKEIECKKREERNAFPNCFVFYLRWSRDGLRTFEESHVKIFSTGKIDMPGLHCPKELQHVQELIRRFVFPHFTDSSSLWVHLSGSKVVLVNSEFQCNFTINTAKLRDLLLAQCGIKAELKNESPGLKCALFVRRDLPLSLDCQPLKMETGDEMMQNRTAAKKHHQSGKYFKVTYTFFQSGEVLVSGACPEEVILFSFQFVRGFLLAHWKEIRSHAQRTNSKKAMKLQYVSKCKYKITYAHLLEKVLATDVDWRVL